MTLDGAGRRLKDARSGDITPAAPVIAHAADSKAGDFAADDQRYD